MARKDVKDTKQEDSSNLPTSGKTQLTMAEERQTLKVPKAGASVAAGGSLLQTFFGRIAPDGSPGWNTLTITGLPINTRVISVWMTEWVGGNHSHAGGAWYTTASVQLFDQGRQCRVRWHLQWGSHLPTACMVIFGPG